MGLDMYMSKRTYVKNWPHMKPEELHQITVLKDNKPLTHIDPKRIEYIIEGIGYWRKAQQIHNWFVKNVQDGKDDCGEYNVREQHIRDLARVIEEVLNNSKIVQQTYKSIKLKGKQIEDPTKAHELLPIADGPFPIGIDYGEEYIQDLKDTQKILKEAFNALRTGASIYYSSSW